MNKNRSQEKLRFMMKIMVVLLLILSVFSGVNSSAQTTQFTEGILETRVKVAGLDMGFITEGIDYSKGDLQGQAMALYAKMPKKEYQAFQALAEKDPLMGLAVALTPPRGTLYVRKGVATVKMRGLGYVLEHYHNIVTDEAFLYTASLVEPGEALTAKYKPSDGYEKLFSANKLITAEKFTITKESGTTTVAGYPCSKSIYTSKTLEPQSVNPDGMPASQPYKLLVYTSAAMSKEINFSHPYYLPEDHGILRIDIFLDDSDTPTMVYEVTAVKPGTITDEQLMIKKTEPQYKLEDLEYGMKVLGIMMGGMASFGAEGGDSEN